MAAACSGQAACVKRSQLRQSCHIPRTGILYLAWLMIDLEVSFSLFARPETYKSTNQASMDPIHVPHRIRRLVLRLRMSASTCSSLAQPPRKNRQVCAYVMVMSLPRPPDPIQGSPELGLKGVSVLCLFMRWQGSPITVFCAGLLRVRVRDRVISKSGCTVCRPNSEVQVIPRRARPSLSDLYGLARILHPATGQPTALHVTILYWNMVSAEERAMSVKSRLYVESTPLPTRSTTSRGSMYPYSRHFSLKGIPILPYIGTLSPKFKLYNGYMES